MYLKMETSCWGAEGEAELDEPLLELSELSECARGAVGSAESFCEARDLKAKAGEALLAKWKPTSSE